MTVLELSTPDPRSFDDASRPFAEAVSSRYAIKRLIGRGGMGMVYLARDRRLDRLVAIKTLPPHMASDESVKQRFLREIRTAGAMSHPRIVPIHGADEVDGFVFFVMGFVDGDSLAAMIRGMGRLEPLEVARILRDVASALSHAHGRGIIHRDVKAENILVDRSTGNAMVTDFGIARLAEAGPLTATGQLLGTVYYISPEQVAGEKVDHRSDLYSLGVVGFLALTGTFPFDAEFASAVLVAHVNKPAPRVRSITPSVPDGLAAIIDRCLAKQPERRYESAGELIDAISAFMAGDRREPASTKPLLASDTEAQVIWGRAAALQAATGVQPRDEVLPRLRDSAADASRTSGLAVDDIRSAGREAGISTRHIDRALVEHGLAPSMLPTTSVEQPVAWWAGIPLQVVEHAEVNGELDPRRFDALLNLVRDGTGKAGSITADRRELGWRAEWFGTTMSMSVTPSGGRTSIRIVERIRGWTVVATSMALAAAAATMPFTHWFFEDTPVPRMIRRLGSPFLDYADRSEIAQGLSIAIALLAIPLCRAVNRSYFGQQQRSLRVLSEAVTTKVQLAIAEDERK